MTPEVMQAHRPAVKVGTREVGSGFADRCQALVGGLEGMLEAAAGERAQERQGKCGPA
ncbi:MAG: hypothetical protein NVSMB17_06410 [Candidatus Dormibacteria bacterium]